MKIFDDIYNQSLNAFKPLKEDIDERELFNENFDDEIELTNSTKRLFEQVYQECNTEQEKSDEGFSFIDEEII
jgi:hypothetical protein